MMGNPADIIIALALAIAIVMCAIGLVFGGKK